MGVTVNPSTKDIVIVTEYMKEGSLADLLGRGNSVNKLSISHVLQLALDIAKGLHYLHIQRPKIVHRGIKSANILVRACTYLAVLI